ncbi:MAG: hypothetical protein HS101_11905 [Planctomycetia bacterium]|jgi:hypothetical protein|nr:hypothetical protein [Planctomycetia bacterium]MCC7316112.1 hypothetical protein [Planctomycetota bacterium]OQZ01532.1 MAG: hypothetical protein B6D36_14115 [Planctomycetes bacterium UTPLA1]
MNASAATDVVLTKPPRRVPAPVCVGALLGAKQLQFGCGIILIAMTVIWILLRGEVFSPLTGLALLGPTTQVQGVVQEVFEGEKVTYKPYATDGYGNSYGLERVTITGVRYGYTGPDGTPLSGVATGLRQNRDEAITDVGASIPVEYSNWHPELSHVPGLKSDAEAKTYILTGAFWLAVFFAVLAGFGILDAMWHGVSQIRLMGRGILTEGRLIDLRQLPVLGMVNLRRMVYSFFDGRQQRQASVVGTADDMATATPQPVFFDPSNPDSIAPASMIAGHFEIDAQGDLTEGDSNPYNYMWLPTACCLAAAWFTLNLFDLAETPEFLKTAIAFMEI